MVDKKFLDREIVASERWFDISNHLYDISYKNSGEEFVGECDYFLCFGRRKPLNFFVSLEPRHLALRVVPYFFF